MMMRSRFAALFVLAMAALSGMTVAGCGKKKNPIQVEDVRPTVRLTNAPVDTTTAYFYSYKLNWIGFDADGRVDHYEYAIDPGAHDTTWVRTIKNEQTIFFRATRPESLNTPIPEGQDFHVFVIVAVDNQGMRSELVSRAFFSFTVAPTVTILQPKPSHLLERLVTPVVTIHWEGHDPDGVFTQKPVKYKFKLFKYGEDPRIDTWIQFPDSLRAAYAPTFAGWDSSTADTTFHKYTNLVPDSRYLFVVVAFDEAGAYSPIFTLDTNILRLQVGFAGQLGPRISMFNSFFSFTYPSGGFSLDPSRVVNLDVPAADPQHDLPLNINWIAFPPDENGGEVEAYRWTMDIADPEDETPRTSERTDLVHWSQWDGTSISALLGTYDAQGKIHGFTGVAPPGQDFEAHNFYVEARDVNGFVSLGLIHFRVIPAKFDFVGRVLIVNDTRFTPDKLFDHPSLLHPDSTQVPSGSWPNAAELDTFLFARGGVRWRMTPNGTLSRPGLFDGYSFDTLGTRNGKENPTVPLPLLAHYRYVIWMLDSNGSQYSPNEIGGPPTSTIFPEATLRYMAEPNRQNTLSSWVTQGGNLWLLGGGCGYGTMADWNNKTNDVGVKTFRNDGVKPDLVPGRFMYDVSHWQSQFRAVGPLAAQLARVDQSDAVLGIGNQYPGIPLRATQPEYQLLPTQLLLKDPSTDPVYPLRTFSDFYNQSTYYEYLAAPNQIQQTISVLGPNGVPHDSSFDVMDTLYVVWRPGIFYFNDWANDQSFNCNPTMTVYRGPDFPNPVIFQGFDLWQYQRPQLIQLVDMVLGQMWGLARSAPTAARASLTPTLQRPPGVRVIRQPTAGAPPGKPWSGLFRRK